MRRVVVVGSSGSGKTTLAGELAGRLGVPHVELDALHHGPGWTPVPAGEFRAAAHAALDDADATGGGWVVCGNYAEVATGIRARADTVVWLDLPRTVVMARILGRTAVRVVHRVELWNGNRESLRMVLALHDPERSIVRWAWGGVQRSRRQYLPVMASTTWSDLRWHRLRTPAEVRAWLAAVPRLPDRSPDRLNRGPHGADNPSEEERGHSDDAQAAGRHLGRMGRDHVRAAR
ncbi:MAG: hypothetical protein MUD13_12435 [Candidatus Nanopelagicales bacterium]|nr:hypothetical protein [Candidatus Nanopelagicales bacterium]